MEVITIEKDRVIRASAKYQEMSSIIIDGEIGKSTSVFHCISEITRGMFDLAKKTIGKADETVSTANNPWIPDLGRTRCRINMESGLNTRRKMVRRMSIWVGANIYMIVPGVRYK
jgi:hypothetical protein